MATISQVKIRNSLEVTESLDNAPAASSSVKSAGFNDAATTLTPTSTPPATKAAAWQPEITGSSSSSSSSSGAPLDTDELAIDLTAVQGIQGEFSASGLKLQVMRLHNPSTNNGSVTIGPGDSNAYNPFGASQEVTVPAGGRLTMEFADGSPEIGASAKNLKLAGTVGDQYELELIFG